MSRGKVFKARLAELAREYEERLQGLERVQSRLRWEDWEALRAEAVEIAREEIRRRRWRGARGGVLPGGYGAEDIADQTIAEMIGGVCRA